MSTTYLRSKFQKIGFSGNDVVRIMNPMGTKFQFITDRKMVEIKRAKDVLPPHYYRILLDFHAHYPIQVGSCHYTAGRVAYLLKDAGVEVCDGFYYDKISHKTYAHTFCKIGDLYFDPTIEFAFSYSKTHRFEYTSERVFEPKEYKVIQHAFSKAVWKDGVRPFITSTLCLGGNNDAGVYYEIRLDDSGMIEYQPIEQWLCRVA